MKVMEDFYEFFGIEVDETGWNTTVRNPIFDDRTKIYQYLFPFDRESVVISEHLTGITAYDFLQAYCEANGITAIFNREGKLEYRTRVIVGYNSKDTVDSSTVVSDPIYIGGEPDREEIIYYKSAKKEIYKENLKS